MIDKSLACAFVLQRLPLDTGRQVRHGHAPTFISAPVLPPSYHPTRSELFSSNDSKNSADDYSTNSQRKEKEIEFLKDELDHVESLEEIVDELEEFALEDLGDEEEDMVWSEEALSEIFGEMIDTGDETATVDTGENDEWNFEDLGEDDAEEDEDLSETYMDVRSMNDFRRMEERIRFSAAEDLERALSQGVVPVSAGVGNEKLAGDYGFDPLKLAEKDYFRQAQRFLSRLLPAEDDRASPSEGNDDHVIERPKALILRDLREAEIRHARLAMLAAVFWPLQELLDRILLDPDQVSPILYGPITLPYFPLLMTAIMLLLGYLDVYAQAVKEMESIGEAFDPGDCFWDPLRILQGAPDSMKRNMQERELLNGRFAMLAFAVFVWEEAVTHLPLIEIGRNDLLLEPAYEVPFVQQWLDAQFSTVDPEVAFVTPSAIDSAQSLKEFLDEAADAALSK